MSEPAQSSVVDQQAPVGKRAITRWTGPGWLWLLLLVIVVVATLVAENFLSSRNLSNVLRQMIPLGIVAVGQTLVILIAGVDLAVAATISMANTALMGIVAGQTANVPLGIAVALGAGLVVGLVNGVVINLTRVPALIVTLGTASIVTGITFLYTGQTNFGEPAQIMNDIGFGSIGPIPILFFLYALIAAVGLIVQNRTPLSSRRPLARSRAFWATAKRNWCRLTSAATPARPSLTPPTPAWWGITASR